MFVTFRRLPQPLRVIPVNHFKMSKRKLPGESEGGNGGNPNQDLIDMLFELSNFEKNVNRNTFKSNAYRKAAGVLAKLDTRISSGSEARKLDGIGAKIADKIDEFLSTGKLGKLDAIRANDDNLSINELTRVAGIGPAKAKMLVDAGFTTVDALRKNPDQLSKAQKIGLKHFDDFEKRIPREEIDKVDKLIQKQLRSIDKRFTATVCGSYRRGLPTSGDIDMLVTHPTFTSETSQSESKSGGPGGNLLKTVVEVLETEGLITDTISHGGTKFMGVCQLQKDLPFRRLDIRIVPQDQFHCGTLYFTGSDQFNKAMRAHAIEQGFTLNEYNLRPVDAARVPQEPLPVTSEEDVFDYISFQYKHPHERSW